MHGAEIVRLSAARASKAGATISLIRYTYTPTVAELNALFHQRPLVAQGQTRLAQVPVATGHCEIYTTQYDTSTISDTGALSTEAVFLLIRSQFTFDSFHVRSQLSSNPLTLFAPIDLQHRWLNVTNSNFSVSGADVIFSEDTL